MVWTQRDCIYISMISLIYFCNILGIEDTIETSTMITLPGLGELKLIIR